MLYHDLGIPRAVSFARMDLEKTLGPLFFARSAECDVCAMPLVLTIELGLPVDRCDVCATWSDAVARMKLGRG